jgi:hypothetical protein
MEGPYEGSRRRSYREVRIAGCRHRTSRPVEPTDTDPCGEDRGDNRPERSPMGIQRAARPSSSSKESGELESIENERVGLQFDLKENKAVPCRGDWLKRTSATTVFSHCINHLHSDRSDLAWAWDLPRSPQFVTVFSDLQWLPVRFQNGLQNRATAIARGNHALDRVTSEVESNVARRRTPCS